MEVVRMQVIGESSEQWFERYECEAPNLSSILGT